MASPMTPKGRVHLRNGWGWESRRLASLATPKGRGAPSATATSWDRSTDPSLVLLVLGNRLDRRNRGRFLLCHHEVVVVWPHPHALPSPAFAAASKDRTVTLENGPSPSALRGAVATVGGGACRNLRRGLKVEARPPLRDGALDGSRCPPALTSHSCKPCHERPDLSSPFTGLGVSTNRRTIAVS